MGGLAQEKDQPKSAQLPPETLATMLACLQSCAGCVYRALVHDFKEMLGLKLNHLVLLASLSRSVSQELSETILTMVANCSNVMNKARQPPPGVLPKGRAPSTSSLDAISPVQVTVALPTK